MTREGSIEYIRKDAMLEHLKQGQSVSGLEEEVKKYWNAHALDYRIGRVADLDFIFLCARHFYELGCRRTAEMYDDIEYDRQMAEEEQHVDGLEEEIERVCAEIEEQNPQHRGLKPSGIAKIARHFAEWGARHSITWGDVQLIDTFILECAREEKEGKDWGESEEFYTEVLRRFHEFNDKKIPEIVAEWEAKYLKK